MFLNRQLDYGRSGIEILVKATRALRRINAPSSFEVYVDGGIRRGSDIFKALALGAKAVGIGRPTLYGLAGYGQPGVEKVLEILKEELKTTMMLCGTASIQEINEEYVMAENLADHIVPVPKDRLFGDTYDPLVTQVHRSKM